MSLLINFSWIITTYIYINTKISNEYFNNVSSQILYSSALQLQNAFLLFGPAGNISNNPLGSLLLLTIFIISIIGFYLSYTSVKLSKTIKKTILSLFMSFILYLGVATTINNPFGILFKKILSKIPKLDVIRYAYPAMHYLSLFFVAVFFGVGFVFIFSKLKDKNKILNFLFLLLIIFIIISYI